MADTATKKQLETYSDFATDDRNEADESFERAEDTDMIAPDGPGIHGPFFIKG
jgi:hypothetical protein